MRGFKIHTVKATRRVVETASRLPNLLLMFIGLQCPHANVSWPWYDEESGKCLQSCNDCAETWQYRGALLVKNHAHFCTRCFHTWGCNKKSGCGTFGADMCPACTLEVKELSKLAKTSKPRRQKVWVCK